MLIFTGCGQKNKPVPKPISKGSPSATGNTSTVVNKNTSSSFSSFSTDSKNISVLKSGNLNLSNYKFALQKAFKSFYPVIQNNKNYKNVRDIVFRGHVQSPIFKGYIIDKTQDKRFLCPSCGHYTLFGILKNYYNVIDYSSYSEIQNTVKDHNVSQITTQDKVYFVFIGNNEIIVLTIPTRLLHTILPYVQNFTDLITHK
jgi:hypothetical protein